MPQALNATNSLNGRRNSAARRAVKARLEDVAGDFEELRDDVGKLAGAVRNAAQVEAKHATEKLHGFRDDLGARAKTGAAYMREKACAHPGAALGIGLGLGLIAGMALTSRR